MDIFKNYESLWKSIIRPTRQTYNLADLGPRVIFTKEKRERVRRVDFDIPNKLGLVLKCSFFEFQERQEQQPPCVVYLHCNSGSRLEGQLYVDGLINKGLSVCVFDFAGSGQSEGEYISLGHFELGDVEVVVNYLKNNWQIPKIAIWGRSMGAVTGLMYISKDPSIAAAVFDSPFSNFMKLAAEIGQIKTGLPKFLVKGALSLVQSTIQEKAGFDLNTLNVLPHIQNCKVPCLFVVSKKDNFVKCHHSEKIRLNYTGESAITYFEGDHNEQRPLGVVKECINYFHARLLENDSNNLIQKSQSTSYLQSQQQQQFQQIQSDNQKHINSQEIQQKYSQQQINQVQLKQQPSEQPQQPKFLRNSQENINIQQIKTNSYPESTKAQTLNISSYVNSSTTINSFRYGQSPQDNQQRQQFQQSSFMTGSIHHHSHSRSNTPNIKIQVDPKTAVNSESIIQKNNPPLTDYPATQNQGVQIHQQAQLPVVPKISFQINNQNGCIKQTVSSPTSEEAINQFKNISIIGKSTPYQQSNQEPQFQQLQPPMTGNTGTSTPIHGQIQSNERDRTYSTFSSAIEGLGTIHSSNSKMPSSNISQPKILDTQRGSQQNGITISSSNDNIGVNNFMQYSQTKQHSSQPVFTLQQQQLDSQPQTMRIKDTSPINNHAFTHAVQFPQSSKTSHTNGQVQNLSKEESKKPTQTLPTHFRQKSGFVSSHEPLNSNSPSFPTLPNENSSRYRSTTADIAILNNSIDQTSLQLKVDEHLTSQQLPAALSTNRLRTQNLQQHSPAIQQLIQFDSARKITEESKFQNPTLILNNKSPHDKTTYREIIPQKGNDSNIPGNRTPMNIPQQVTTQSLVSPRLEIGQGFTKDYNKNALVNNTKISIDFDKSNNQSMSKELRHTNNNDNNQKNPFLFSKQISGVITSTKKEQLLSGSKSRPVLHTNTGNGKSLINQTPMWLLTETNNTTNALNGSIHTPQSKTASAQMNMTNSNNRSSNHNNHNQFPGKNINNGFLPVNAFSFNGDTQQSQQKTDFQHYHAPLLSQRSESKITSTGKVPRISPCTDIGSFGQSKPPVIIQTSTFNVHQPTNRNTNDNHILQEQNLNALPKQNNLDNHQKITSPSMKYLNQPQIQQPIQVKQLISPKSIPSATIAQDLSQEYLGVISQKQSNKVDFQNKRIHNNVPIQRVNLSNDENVYQKIETLDSNRSQNSFKYPNYEVQKPNNNMSASKTGAVANIPRETLPPFYWALEQKSQRSSEENAYSINQQQVDIKEQQTQNLQDAEAIKKSRSSTTPTFKPDFIRNLQSTRVLQVLPNTQQEQDVSPYFVQPPQQTTISTNFGVIRQHQYSVHEVNQASKTSAAFYKAPLYQNL